MIAQKHSFFCGREKQLNLVVFSTLILVFLLSNFIYAQSPSAPAPPGKKWEIVDNLSDEFNSFDGNKWFRPLWNYPEPNFMVNENSGVSRGNLWIKATRGSGNQWFVSSRVQSRAQIKYPMYTECRMKASSISALNTFWMNNGDVNNRDEIDICENNAAPTGNPSNGAETPFINASNWWYAENGTNYDGNSRGQTANNHNSTKNLSRNNPLRGVKLDAAYHIIGCFWINEKSFEWWLDGEKVGETTLNIPQVFTRNQNLIWDLWTNPHDGFPAQSDLQNNNINTMYVDWVHTYKLVNGRGRPGTNSGNAAVKVTGVRLTPSNQSLIVGQTGNVTGAVIPSSAAVKTMTFTSNNTNVVTVTDSGVITAIASGRATITAKTTDGGFTTTSTVTVNSNNPPAPVPAPIGGVDLAKGKPAFQSSVFKNSASSFGPKRVVDGNGSTFNATKRQKGAWWEVNLNDSYTINQVKIWNRGDCCAERLKNFDIKIYDKRGGKVVKSIYVKDQPSTSGSSYNVNATGRIVRIQLRGNNHLSMDQVSVFGVTNTNNGGAMTIQAENFTTTSGTFNDSSQGGPGIGVRRAKNFISFVNEGDYVDYEVNIPRTGFYRINYQISSPNAGSTITFGIPGQDFHTTTVPKTGGWRNYRSLESSSVENFSAGTHIVRLKAGGKRWAWNLDKFTMRFAGSSKSFDLSSISEINGVNNDTNGKVFVYPVPAQSNITIKGTSDGEKEVSIFNMTGSIVIKTKVIVVSSEANLDISGLSKGMYILLIDGKTVSLVIN